MATRVEVRGWFTEESYRVPEELDKIIDGMIKAGYMEEKDGLFYVTKKGYFEITYGKLKTWEPGHMDREKIKKEIQQ